MNVLMKKDCNGRYRAKSIRHQYLHKDGKFTHADGFGIFKPIEHQPPVEEPDAEYPLLLSTGRILYHYNITTAGYSKHLTEHRPEELVQIHPIDAKRLGISDKDTVTVSSRRGAVQRQSLGNR